MWKITNTKDFYHINHPKLRITNTIKKGFQETDKELQLRLINNCKDKELYNLYGNTFFISLIKNTPECIHIFIKKSSFMCENYNVTCYQIDNNKMTKLNEYIVNPKKFYK